MLSHGVGGGDQKRGPDGTYFPISQQSGWGSRGPGELHPSNFITQKWHLIIPIGIYYASNFEARIVSFNAIQNITIKQQLRPASTSALWPQIPTHHPYTLWCILSLTFPMGGSLPAMLPPQWEHTNVPHTPLALQVAADTSICNTRYHSY